MAEGRIVEKGTAQELARTQGVYARLASATALVGADR
jgi:ABC-type multidrug transport system fused ATPase/permease subunit